MLLLCKALLNDTLQHVWGDCVHSSFGDDHYISNHLFNSRHAESAKARYGQTLLLARGRGPGMRLAFPIEKYREVQATSYKTLNRRAFVHSWCMHKINFSHDWNPIRSSLNSRNANLQHAIEAKTLPVLELEPPIDLSGRQGCFDKNAQNKVCFFDRNELWDTWVVKHTHSQRSIELISWELILPSHGSWLQENWSCGTEL